jgi:hypothetical protein
MRNRTKAQAKWDMGNYKRDQLQLYIDEAGFESWMMEYTEARDFSECTDEEFLEIESIQEQMWLEVHYWF